MVSYYNLGLYGAKSYPSNIPYPSSTWHPGNYHHTPNQFLSDGDAPPQMYYPHMFNSSPDSWTTHGPENYGTQTGLLQSGHSGTVHINQTTNQNEHINTGINSLPSPPITVSGSEMSSPGAVNGSTSPQTAPNRPEANKSPYEWIKRTSYTNQPNPGRIFLDYYYIPHILYIVLKFYKHTEKNYI